MSEIHMTYENMDIDSLGEAIDKTIEQLDQDKCSYAFVILEEWLTNIIKYSKVPDSIINIDILSDSAIMISDNGVPFDVTAYPYIQPDVHTIGGKGIFLIRELTKELRYEYKNGKNCVTIVFA